VAAVLALQLAFTYAPFMQRLFLSEGLPVASGAQVLGAGVLVLLVLEAEKALLRRTGLLQA
jgi:hypothetical protein